MADDGREGVITRTRTGSRPRARRGEGERLRQEILDGAARLLRESGDEEAVSIRAVAEAVGVTPPSIYMHFADKGALMRAVCSDQFTVLHDYLEAAVEGVDDPDEQLRQRGKAYVRFGVEHPEHYRLLFMAKSGAIPAPDDHLLSAASGFSQLVANVERCIDAGTIAPQDPLLVATGLWTLVHGVTSLAISVPGFPMVGLETLLDHLLDVQHRGLRSD